MEGAGIMSFGDDTLDPSNRPVCCCGHDMYLHEKANSTQCEAEGCPCMQFIGVGSKVAHEAMTVQRLAKRFVDMDTYAKYLELRIKAVKALVAKQAEDEGLWAVPIPPQKQAISEAYLQQELRKLHDLVEQIDLT